MAVYQNPILRGDYSDPDVVRVGEDYYMISSSFTYVPGIPLLHSRDLVHWRLINYVCRELPFDRYDRPCHNRGTWAPSIRYHDGQFYVYVCLPDEGLFCFKARDPYGRWTMFHVKAVSGWIDPCPLWDDDGKAYLLHAFAPSRAGIGNVLYLHRMSPDGTEILDRGHMVFDGGDQHRTTEGPKFYKVGDTYYILAPAGGVKTGWQLAMRADNPYGPYEVKIVLAQGASPVNGPHQGGWVDTPQGQQWFIHFQDQGPYGRITHLQPVLMRDGWPEMGVQPDPDGVGEPVLTYPVPETGQVSPMDIPTSDEFDSALGLQWQFQANVRPTWYDVGERPGWLRLFAARPAQTPTLFHLGAYLSQLMQYGSFDMTACVEFEPQQASDCAGLAMMGYTYRYLAVEKDCAVLYEGMAVKTDRGDEAVSEREIERIAWAQRRAYLRMQVRDGCRVQFAISADGQSWQEMGAPFAAAPGGWTGARPGIFCMNRQGRVSAGYADFDYVRITPVKHEIVYPV